MSVSSNSICSFFYSCVSSSAWKVELPYDLFGRELHGLVNALSGLVLFLRDSHLKIFISFCENCFNSDSAFLNIAEIETAVFASCAPHKILCFVTFSTYVQYVSFRFCNALLSHRAIRCL